MGCPYCGHENTAGARFCANPQCGRFLEHGSTPAAPPPPAGPGAPGGAAPLPGTTPAVSTAGPGVPDAAPAAAPSPDAAPNPFDPPGFGSATPAGPAPAAGPSIGGTSSGFQAQATPARPQAQYTFTRARSDPVQVSPVDGGGPLADAPSGGSRSPDGRQGLFAVFDDGTAEVATGSEWVAQVKITNTGVIVERVDLRVEGLPADWVTFEPAQVNLDQNQEQVVLMRIRPPRSAQTAAGRMPYSITVWSITNPAVRVSLGAMLTVSAFSGARVVLDPLVTNSRRKSTYTAVVTNEGNTQLTATLSARDPQNMVRVHPPTQEITAPPGQPVSVELVATAKKRVWSGPARSHRIAVDVSSPYGPVGGAEGVLTQDPMLPAWTFKVVAVATAIFVLLSVLGVRRWLEVRPRAVPNVVNASSDDATVTLLKAGFAQPRINTVPNAAPAMAVVAQDPEADALLGGGQPVTLTVSMGPAPTDVPNVQGLTLDDAKARLNEAGFKPVVDKPISDAAPKDHVAKQNPLPGTPAAGGAVVTLTPSLGPEMVSVPDLSRKTRAEVDGQLQQAGLTLTVGTDKPPANSRAEPGTVISQKPAANTKVAKGSAVTVSFAPAAAAPGASGGASGGGGSGGGGSGGGGSGGGPNGSASGGGGLPAPPPPG